MIDTPEINTPEIVREKLDKLATLGTADAIALELEAQGIKADRTNAHTCAIARYLGNPANVNVSHPGPGVVGVTGAYVSVYTGENHDVHPRVDVPEVVGEFIDNFDLRRYPALLNLPDPIQALAARFRRT